MADNPKVIHVTEYIARQLEGLAQRVREGAIRGFDLAWNVGPAQQEPHKLFGIWIAHAPTACEFISQFVADEPVEAVARAIEQELARTEPPAAPPIEVEDLIPPETPEGVPISMEPLPEEEPDELVDADFSIKDGEGPDDE